MHLKLFTYLRRQIYNGFIEKELNKSREIKAEIIKINALMQTAVMKVIINNSCNADNAKTYRKYPPIIFFA